MSEVTACKESELSTVADIINESALAYKGVIPADRWHEPYMPLPELKAEVTRGVQFYAYRRDGEILGVMGVQDVRDVTLIRHAYVRTKSRGQGIGGSLLEFMYRQTTRPVLIGAWKAATWAIRFYEKNGFAVVSEAEKNRLLRIYWSIPARQVEESVVLADERWRKNDANRK
ncbi:MAG TPA: GNAT family N-acetyltransferase [Opitutaceae bacterium]|nr:GNAT family N-acetyltransferase [Opitutaceae bacterium]